MTSTRVAVESRGGDTIPLWRHDEWRTRFPWLVQGITGKGEAEVPFDLGLFGSTPVGETMERWELLRTATGMRRIVHSRQVHGAELRSHGPGDEDGLLISHGRDGHVTRAADLLLTVSVADCVPVYVVDASTRAIALVHAGWRGVAAGIVERAIARLLSWHSDVGEELWLHCGPAICGVCYEVGPEVHAAVRPQEPAPDGPSPIDLRAEIARRAVAQGIGLDRVTVSAHCTLCGPGAFFSHRAGSPGRQMAILGIRGVEEG